MSAVPHSQEPRKRCVKVQKKTASKQDFLLIFEVPSLVQIFVCIVQ